MQAYDRPNTELQKEAEKRALADVYGFSDGPFSAVQWRKTLPSEVQAAVEAVIVHVYHTT